MNKIYLLPLLLFALILFSSPEQAQWEGINETIISHISPCEVAMLTEIPNGTAMQPPAHSTPLPSLRFIHITIATTSLFTSR